MSNLVPLEDLTGMLEEMNLDTLASAYYGWKEYRDHLTEMLGRCEMAIRNHLGNLGAKEALTRDHTIALTGGGLSYSYNGKRLAELQLYLTQEEWQQCVSIPPPVQPPPKYNTNKIKALVSKRGIEAMTIFEEAITITERPNRLEIKLREEKE